MRRAANARSRYAAGPISGVFRPPSRQIPMTTAQSTLNTNIPLESAGRRFDAALAELFPDYSRSRLTTWIKAGDVLLSIEAMKMEAAITAPKAGTVARIAVTPTAGVEGGDLLVVIS